VLIRSDGAALLGRRPESKVYAGYWEFPGGKVEPGEPVRDALAREIREELGVEIVRAHPWITRVFVYPHATVRLHFHRVLAWRGEPRALEHQAIAWQHPESVDLAPMLPANGPVLRALVASRRVRKSPGERARREGIFLEARSALQSGLKLVQVREKKLGRGELKGLARRVLELARAHGAKVLLNSDVDLAREIGADGVHLTAAQLEGSRPDLPWCGGVVSFAAELRRAEALGADLAVLGPVARRPRTRTRSARLGSVPEGAAGASIPVYALAASCRATWKQPELRRARPRHGAGRLGRLVGLFRLGLVLVFLERNV